MSLRYHHLRYADHVALDARNDEGLHVLHASGRGAEVELPAGWMSLWLPLAGRLRLGVHDGNWELGPGDAQLWREGRVSAGSRLPCGWLALAGPVAAWKQHRGSDPGLTDIELFPWEGRASRELRRLLVRLARRVRGDARALAPLLAALFAELVGQQRELQARLPRCSGRSLQRRQQTLLRLLRVQQQIRRHPDARLDLAQLARSASYSPCHLIRIYRDVFDETPTEYATRLRSDRAWQLVRDTAMPVCEITEVLGFESQSAFCRAFKHSFGLTATQARRRGDPLAASAA